MKRILCSLIVFLITLMLLCGCSREHETSVTGDAISKSLQQQIAEAMRQQENVTVYWKSGARNYGTFGNCTFFFVPGNSFGESHSRIGEYTFCHNPGGRIWVYNNGVVTGLRDAYDTKMITDEQLSQFYHAYESYSDTIFKTAGASYSDVQSHMVAVPEETIRGFNQAWKNLTGHEQTWDGTHGYYGTYADCVVYFHPGAMTVKSCMQVADYLFEYSESFNIYVYKSDSICSLQEAYETGQLSYEDISVIYTYHQILNSRGAYSQTLSDDLRAEILAYYGKDGNHDNAFTVAGRQYYGTYNGYVILMIGGNMEVVTEMNVGGRVFLWGTSMSLEAYKDGATYNLKELYESGAITAADLDQILALHKAYFATEHNWDYDQYLQKD